MPVSFPEGIITPCGHKRFDLFRSADHPHRFIPVCGDS